MLKPVSMPSQDTTAGWIDLVGSEMRVGTAGLYSYILKCTTADSKIRILGSHTKDFALYDIDEPETILATDEVKGFGGPAFYKHYKVQIMESSAGGAVEGTGASK